jgi:hypothetical protein
MVFRKKKFLSRWFDSIKKIFFFKPMIDTVGQKWKIFNQWIDTIGSQHDRQYPSIVSVSIHRDYAQPNVKTVKRDSVKKSAAAKLLKWRKQRYILQKKAA